MSLILGNIHYWLYKKIELVAQREALLYQNTKSDYNDFAEEIYGDTVALFGERSTFQSPLEAVIDRENIHSWLQREIEKVEVHEANFCKDLADILGDEGKRLIFSTFQEHGQQCGKSVRDLDRQITAISIYELLQDFYLNGMPCEGGNRILSRSEDAVVWEGTHPYQVKNWQKAGVDFLLMQKAYQRWFEGFVGAISEQFAFLHKEEGFQTYGFYRNR